MEQLNINDSNSGVFSAQKITKYWRNNIPTWNSTTFTDTYFQPNEHSLLAQDENGEFLDKTEGRAKAQEIDVNGIEWKRASEIFGEKHLLLFDEKIECNDIKQGSLGNCYFLSALAALTEFPTLIHQIFRSKEISPHGYYEIVLFIDGEWQIIFLDDFFPVIKGTKNFAFSRPNGNELWVLLLEKAWAKVNGGYANIISGMPTDTLAALTGFATQKLHHESIPLEELWEFLKKADESDKIMCTSTHSDGKYESYGLVSRHAYTLIGAKSKMHEGGELRLVKIRNPWGNKEWIGDWSDKSGLWTDELRTYFGKSEADVDDGTFYMTLNDFVICFDWTYICNIMYDSNIKSFHIDSEELKVPQVFNFYINQPASVSISVVSKHWRYNREIKNKNRPITLVIGKYNAENSSFTQVAGEYSAQENVDYVNSLTEGLYTVWVYCDHDSCQEPKAEFYSVIFSSSTKYAVRHESSDKNFELIKEMILGGLREQNSGRIQSEDCVVLQGNSYLRTGIGYIAVFNQKDNYYQKWTNDASGMVQMSLFPPHEGKKNFEFFVPNKGREICLGMKTGQQGTFWFNVKASYITSPGKAPVSAKKANLEMFVSNQVYYEDINDDNYYDYVSSSHEDSKKELRFKHIDTKNAALEDLVDAYPDFMNKLLELPGEDNEKYNWVKIDIGGDFYIGQKSTETRKFHGRGMYCFSHDKSFYIGNWHNGVRHGSGKLCNADSSPIHEGEYCNGKRQGKGRYFFSCGHIYDGNFENDRFHGPAVYTYEDGSRWEGTYANGARLGKGMYYPVDGEPFEA